MDTSNRARILPLPTSRTKPNRARNVIRILYTKEIDDRNLSSPRLRLHGVTNGQWLALKRTIAFPYVCFRATWWQKKHMPGHQEQRDHTHQTYAHGDTMQINIC